MTSFIGRPPGTPPAARDGLLPLARAAAPSATEVDVISITTVHAHRKSQPGARRATIPGARALTHRGARPHCRGPSAREATPRIPRSEVTDPGLDLGPGLKPRHQVRVTKVFHAKPHVILLDFSAVLVDAGGVEENENGHQDRESAVETEKGAFRASRGFSGGGLPPAGVSVRSVRHELGLTQELFARLVGCSVRTLADWESGNAPPAPGPSG